MDDVYATAKWGNRMLRPLTALYHRLGKYRETESLDLCPQKLQNDVRPPRPTAGRLARTVDKDTELSDSEGGARDPAWIPGKPDHRRIKHKYVVRGERHRRRPRVRSVMRSPEVLRTLPGAIEIATPLITGKSVDMLGLQNTIKLSNGQQTELSSRKFFSLSPERSQDRKKPERRTRQSRFPQQDGQWRVSLESSKDTNYVDIVQRLDSLFLRFLEKTRVEDSVRPRTSPTARSLLLTVIRQLPEFITEEQRLHDEVDHNDDVDMADAYFTELEAAYGSNPKGWWPLREAVRAQGIFLVRDMMHDGWIRPILASALIEKCIDAGENDAVEALLSTLLLMMNSYDHPDAFDPWRPGESTRDPLGLLYRYWKKSGNLAYVFNELSKLLSSGTLPPEWMVTVSWKTCMAAATSSLSIVDGQSAAATRLIEAVVIAACGIYPNRGGPQSHTPWPSSQREMKRQMSGNNDSQVNRGRCPVYIQDALGNLVSSLIVAICGMYFVRGDKSETEGDDFSARMGHLLERVALIVQRALELNPPRVKDLSDAHSLRRGYVLLGHYLLKYGQDHPRPEADSEGPLVINSPLSFYRLLSGNMDMIKELSALVGQVVRCCEKGERAQCHRARVFCAQLLNSRKFGATTLALFLGKVAVEVSMDFAQMSQDPDDHAWAADIQETLATTVKIGSHDAESETTNSSDCEMPSFRWEESIGEWVARTPLFKTTVVRPKILPRPRVLIPSRASLSPSSSVNDDSPSPPNSPASSVTSSSPPPRLKRTWRTESLPDRRKKIRTSHEPLSSGDESPESFLNLTAHRRNSLVPIQDDDVSKSMNIAVIIYNQSSTQTPAGQAMHRRGPGRPRKHASGKRHVAEVARPRFLRHRALVIPCSEGEESDDELSFL